MTAKTKTEHGKDAFQKLTSDCLMFAPCPPAGGLMVAEGAHLAKPTPRLVPLASRRMRVEMTWLKGLSMLSSSCSSMDSGRLEMYRLVGSCSCC